MNVVGTAIPERAWQTSALLDVMGAAAGLAFGAGQMNLTGLTPNGHRFFASPRQVWLVDTSSAEVNGRNVGPLGRQVEQASLGDFVVPQRGLFAVTRARLETPAPARGARAVAFGACTPATPRRASED